MTPGTPRNRSEQSLTNSFERYLQDKGKGRGGDGGNYRRNAARELERFAEWAAGDRGENDWTGIVPDDVDRELTFDDLDERVFREYARYLGGDRGLKQNTVQTYYRYISAWCVKLRTTRNVHGFFYSQLRSNRMTERAYQNLQGHD